MKCSTLQHVTFAATVLLNHAYHIIVTLTCELRHILRKYNTDLRRRVRTLCTYCCWQCTYSSFSAAYQRQSFSWKQGSWDQNEAHLEPIGPRWAPCWLHELCYLGPCARTYMRCLQRMQIENFEVAPKFWYNYFLSRRLENIVVNI